MKRHAMLLVSFVLLGAGALPVHAERMRILITNDDGIASEGISALIDALRPHADLVVSAPAGNHSGASQSMTYIGQKLTVTSTERAPGVPGYAVHGTPADAVAFGVMELGRERPFDLVVSGINKGQNVGTLAGLSGTLGAARQAADLGVRAIAISQSYDPDGDWDFTLAARYAAQLARELERLGDRAPWLISVNVPLAPKGVRFARIGGDPIERRGFKLLEQRPDGTSVYAFQLDFADAAPAGTDTAALLQGFVTISVLDTDPSSAPPRWLSGNERITALPPLR